jgi:hypothetical protein
MSGMTETYDPHSISILGGVGNKIIDGASPNNSQVGHTIIGGKDNQMTLRGSGKQDTIVGGASNTMNANGGYNQIFGGASNDISGEDFNSIVGGQNNSITGGRRNTIVGGYYGVIQGGVGNIILGLQSGQITSGDNNIILGGVGCNLTTGTYKSQILNGESNQISADNRLATIINGYNNNISAGGQGASIRQSWDCNITGSGAYRSIIDGSDNCDITTSNHYQNGIYASKDSSITNLERAVMIGTSGRTALYSATTHFDNHHTYQVESFDVFNAGAVSGNIDVDLSKASLYYFELTGNTTPNFINWVEGQRVQFWVFNNGTHTIPTITISGGGDVYAKAGSVNPTNNGRTGYYGTIVNGDMYLDEHLNFQAL